MIGGRRATWVAKAVVAYRGTEVRQVQMVIGVRMAQMGEGRKGTQGNRDSGDRRAIGGPVVLPVLIGLGMRRAGGRRAAKSWR